MKVYTGIGSRKTPPNILNLMYQIGKILGKNNWILRSGGALGADSEFERGARSVSGKCEIYLPWEGYNNRTEKSEIPGWCFEIAAQQHPAWRQLKPGAKRLHARNVLQILGYDQIPSHCVICWTPDGADGCSTETSILTGGTGQAIRIAKAYQVPVFNLFNDYHRESICEKLSLYL